MIKEINGGNFKRTFFFLAGIIATIAYRIIVALEGTWIRASWYIGTIGFILYFGHRSSIQKKRSQMVVDNKLISLVRGMKGLKPKQKSALKYLVETAKTSKARWNSLFIFWLSIAALVVGVLMDLGWIIF